ncbi:hypothetical protein [Pseudomarimonas arenosa]|uniref:Uncharacterized protein n=1 Tax=Pseudomarimonas arenosa TaxID=2774145 RepID=A0AAW3ZR07_9GAMM|nr:hypothetical protein [Pseudomarimonas arenosa]MBD8526701.1 hypothetical protein [Pseudomarimonas arenosa]
MARTRFDIPEVPSRWRYLRWLALLLLPLPLIYGLSLHHAQSLADRAILLSLGAGQLQRDLAWVDVRGQIHVGQVSFTAEGGDRVWRAAKAEISTPGWIWWLGQAIEFDPRRRPISRLRVEFRQLEVGDGREPALGELGPVGVSGAPFETEGCSGALSWSDSELREMGIDPQAARLRFEFHSRDSLLETDIEYEVAESSRARLLRSQRLPMPLTVLLVDQFPRLTQQETWQVEDLGFVRKRTKYCAERSAISQREMIERHLQSVSRLLETVGLEAVPVMTEFYRLYARDGGDLSLQLRYPEPWAAHPEATLGLDQETLASSQGTMQRGEESAVFLWPTRPIRALPEWSGGMPTYDALQRELNGGGIDLGIESAAPPLWSRRPADQIDLSGLGMPNLDDAYLLLTGGTAGIISGDTPATEPPPSDAVNTADAAAPDTAPATDATTPATSTPAATASGSAARGTSSPLIPPPRTVVIGRQSKDIEWEQLPNAVGKRVRIITQSGAQRYAELIEANADEILIRTRIGGGIAEYRIKREAFRSATLAD